MAALIILLVAVAALAVFVTAAVAGGVDSRDGSADPRSPVYPVGIN